MTLLTGELRVPADAGCLDGHFPGQPLVPGVVLLDSVIRLAEAGWSLRVTAVSQCKFLQPLKPEQACKIICERRDAGQADFRLEIGQTVVAQGRLKLAED